MQISITSNHSIKDLVLNTSKIEIKDVDEFKTSNLDGGEGTWIVIVTILSQSIPHILDFIKNMREENGVKSIKVGDVEIKNPTEDMVRQLLENSNNSDDTE